MEEEEFSELRKSFERAKKFFKILSWNNIIWGAQRMEQQQKAHEKHPSLFIVKILNIKSPVCIVFFQVSYHPAGLWGWGESSSKQH